MAIQVDLFGAEVDVGESRRESPPPVNNMDLVTSVLTTAARSGFVLTGTQQGVRRWHNEDEARTVSAEVEAAVHQLLAAGWLTVGGRHEARLGAHRRQVRSVLVPKKTRQTLQRWQSLKDPWCHRDTRK